MNLQIYNIYTITDFSDVSALNQLTSLSIYNTNFSDVVYLKDMANLKYLKLINNAIYDTAEYSDDEGNKVTYNNLQILIDLYNYGSLRTLYISGNKLTLDSTNTLYTTLLGLTWTAKDF